jgi:hypothetical protein
LRNSTESSDQDREKLDDDDDNLALDNEENNDRVLGMASQIHSKYIILKINDKKNVLALFKVIREVAEGREYVACNKIAALTTAKLFNRINYYLTITARSILRWCSVQDKIIEKSGPRIDNQFVSEVWGNSLYPFLCPHVRYSPLSQRMRTEVRWWEPVALTSFLEFLPNHPRSHGHQLAIAFAETEHFLLAGGAAVNYPH